MDFDDLKEFVAEHLLITQSECQKGSHRISLAFEDTCGRQARRVETPNEYWMDVLLALSRALRRGESPRNERQTKPPGRQPEGQCAVCQRNT